ncbi:urease accessory protein UreD [Pectinatus brassicae]|uniref:Urease accessory protein UreD n=1 Tax=Pectinatus brassicae TaxID=862415 RepID=A0A840UUA8_9FIRM|nr:urease accessory protein UreD [Pectinatus brassicae]MBB5336045.1 urease accessory protein [Pectinatus brassicae]
MLNEKQSIASNAYGKTSYLNLKFIEQQHKTILDDAFFTAPFKIMKPFIAKKLAHFMILTASAGIMEGDCQKLNIELESGSAVELTAQSFEKIHKMNNGEAVRNTKITLDKDTILFYMPQPVIPFSQSAFTNKTDIYLTNQTARLFYSEILNCGRVARQEQFLYRKYCAPLKIYIDNIISYFENTRYIPQQQNLTSFGFYENYTHLATILIFNFAINNEFCANLHKIINENNRIDGGISCILNKHLCIKAFAHSAESLINFIDTVKNELDTQ